MKKIVLMSQVSVLTLALSSASFASLETEDPMQAEEHQAVMAHLNAQINKAEMEKLEHTIVNATSDNLLEHHEALDAVLGDLRKANSERMQHMIKRSQRWLKFHDYAKGWLKGGSFIVGGTAGTIFTISLIGALGCEVQSTLGTWSGGLAAGALFLLYLGNKSTGAFLQLSRNLSKLEDYLNAYLGLSMEEIKKRNLQGSLSNDIWTEAHVIPRSGSHDELSQMEEGLAVNDKGKEEEIPLVPGQTVQEEEEMTVVIDNGHTFEHDGQLVDETGAPSTFTSIVLSPVEEK